MKKIKFVQKLVCGMMVVCMMFTTFPNPVYANTLTYDAFYLAQKEVIDEINAEYGLNIVIQPSDNASEFDAALADIDEFRNFFTAHAQEQRRMQDELDEAGECLEILCV